MIISKTPFRIPVAGGGTDLEFYFKKKGSTFYSLAIDQYVYVFLTPRTIDEKYLIQTTSTQFASNLNEVNHHLIRETIKYFKIEEPLHIGTYTTVPTLTGLGSSSSLVVGLINCILKYKKIKMNDKEIIKIAFKIEREICANAGGWQDQIISQMGGLIKTEINKKGKLTIKKISKKPRLINLIKKNLLLVYSKQKRQSSKVILSQKNNLSAVIENYDLIKSLTKEIPNIIDNGTPMLLARLFSTHWEIKKKLSNKISNKKINDLYNLLINKCSFIGGKLIGAGGGGFFLMITSNKKKSLKLLKKNSISYMNFNIDYSGSRILNNY
jgi:D-glycero-alpha-D-manno-heptose-7-phosphate kinase